MTLPAATDSTATMPEGDGVSLRRLTGSVGIEMSGVNLNAPIGDDLANRLRDALHNNSVLIVRGQFLTPESHVRLAKVFGDPFMPSYYAANSLAGFPEIAIVPNFGKAKAPAEGWHTDWSHLRVPPTVSVSIEQGLAPAGGDTMFSNQYVAYDRLSDGMKDFLVGRRVKFVGSRPVGEVRKMEGTSDHLPKQSREEVANWHLIARPHPATGRTALYLNRPGEAMVQFEGMTPAESLPILRYLYDLSSNPDNVYRHSWQAGDVVCWDNQCAMHYGVHDYGDAERTLHRITVGGAT